MATKTPHAARGRKRANEPHLEDVGNVGRATGVKIPDFANGDDDADNLSAYFPTTGKTNRGQRKSDLLLVSSEDMDVAESSGLEVSEVLQQRSIRSSHKLPPATRSPGKTHMRGTPKRPSSLGPISAAQTPATAPRSTSQNRDPRARLDFTLGRSPRRTITPKPQTNGRRSGTFSISPSPEKGRRATEPLQDVETDYDDTVGNIDTFDPQMDDVLDNDTLKDMQPDTGLDDSLAPSEGSARRSKRPANAQVSTRRTRQSDQSLDLQANEAEDEAPIPEVENEPELEVDEPMDEVQDEPGEPEEAPPLKKKRGRPAKASTAEEPNSKKPRTGGKNAKAAKAQEDENTKKSIQSKAVPTKQPSNTKTVAGNDTKSNVRMRHETPFDEADPQYTSRSGRLIYKPLAHWKNERVNLQPTATEDGGFVYQITDLVRMEDVTPKKRIVKRTGENTVVRRRPKKKVTTIYEESDPEDNEEAWEASEGVISGAVRMWDPEQEIGIDDKRQQELAFAASEIEARDNAEGSFRFAKTLTMPFFGSGIVELPPGGIKKTKNSRRMQMMFFVHFGKVTVEVQNTRFAISKGGVWQVPRGNNYSIANETKHDAKIFFAQGCEVDLSAAAAQPQSGEPTQE